MEYLLVEFFEEPDKPTEVIPANWCVDETRTTCYWPSHISCPLKFKRAVLENLAPTTSWPSSNKIRIRRTFDNYEQAKKKLEKFMETSDLDTTSDERRIRKRNRKYLTDSSDEESDERPTIKVSRDDGRTRVAMASSPVPSVSRLPVLPQPFANGVALGRKPGITTVVDDCVSVDDFSTPDRVPRLKAVTPRQSNVRTPSHCARASMSHLSGEATVVGQRSEGFMTPNRVTEMIGEVGLKKIFDVMGQILAECQDNKRMLQHIIANTKFAEQPVTNITLPENLVLPIASHEDFSSLNDMLGDGNVRRAMICQLATLGGTNLKDAVRRLLAKLLTHELCLQYSWTGSKGGKRALLKLANVVRLINDVVKKQPSLQATTVLDIEVVIKSYLRTASDRQGGRSRRQRKTEHIILNRTASDRLAGEVSEDTME